MGPLVGAWHVYQRQVSLTVTRLCQACARSPRTRMCSLPRESSNTLVTTQAAKKQCKQCQVETGFARFLVRALPMFVSHSLHSACMASSQTSASLVSPLRLTAQASLYS